MVADEQRLPGRIRRGGRVPVGVGTLDRVGGAPEVVVVLGLPAGDHRVRRRNPDVAEQPRGLAQVEPTRDGHAADGTAVLGVRLIGEEAGVLGLERRPGADDAADVLELVDVMRVGPARQLVRLVRPVLGLRVERERPHLAELDVDRRRRRDRLEDSRSRRRLDVGNDVVEVVAGPHREHARGGGGADGLASVLRDPVRDRRHEGVVGGLDRRGLRRNAGDEDVSCRLRDGRVGGRLRRCGHSGCERLETALDGGDGVVHRPVHHRRERSAARGWTARGDRLLGDAAPIDDRVLARCGRRCR